MSEINHDLMWYMAENHPIATGELNEIVVAQRRYLAAMATPGRWQTVEAGGIVFAMMVGAEQPPAKLECRKFEGLELHELDLPYSTWIGAVCRNQDLSGANLSCSLLCDGDFTGTSFEGACLSYSDFSRAILHDCNFKNATLVCVDIENADFTGANMDGAEIVAAKNADKVIGIAIDHPSSRDMIESF
jgi:hypothetical protein